MLRTAILALALGLPGVAGAEEFPHSAMGLEVRSDAGTVLSRVEAVERDGEGRIVAVEAPGLAPADAPAAAADLVAERDAERFFINLPASPRTQRGGGAIQTAAR